MTAPASQYVISGQSVIPIIIPPADYTNNILYTSNESLLGMSLAPDSDLDQATIYYTDPLGGGQPLSYTIGPGSFLNIPMNITQSVHSPTPTLTTGQIIVTTARAWFQSDADWYAGAVNPVVGPYLKLFGYFQTPQSGIPSKRTDSVFVGSTLLPDSSSHSLFRLPSYGRRFFSFQFHGGANSTNVVITGYTNVFAGNVQLATFTLAPGGHNSYSASDVVYEAVDITVQGTGGDTLTYSFFLSDTP